MKKNTTEREALERRKRHCWQSYVISIQVLKFYSMNVGCEAEIDREANRLNK